jgi:hypothetical protein
MYVPYFRGRQYELLALRELAENRLLGNSVIPVVEPIKVSSTFTSTMAAFAQSQLRIGLVFNPTVGDLSKNGQAITDLYALSDGDRVIPSVIINESAKACLCSLEENDIPRSSTLAVLSNRDFFDLYKTEFNSTAPRLTMFPDVRKIRHDIKQNKILFENRFVKQSRNADYPEDEFFSEDHLYYAGDGYQGFGDYSIVGDDYAENAFAPHAVAIHIVYFAEDETLRIRHFVSDSNTDISDVAGKFHEAVSKLAIWHRSISPNQLTNGLQTFLLHHENGTYPGLPTLKKLSIMHHLELVGKFLDEKAQI